MWNLLYTLSHLVITITMSQILIILLYRLKKLRLAQGYIAKKSGFYSVLSFFMAFAFLSDKDEEEIILNYRIIEKFLICLLYW